MMILYLVSASLFDIFGCLLQQSNGERATDCVYLILLPTDYVEVSISLDKLFLDHLCYLS